MRISSLTLELYRAEEYKLEHHSLSSLALDRLQCGSHSCHTVQLATVGMHGPLQGLTQLFRHLQYKKISTEN